MDMYLIDKIKIISFIQEHVVLYMLQCILDYPNRLNLI